MLNNNSYQHSIYKKAFISHKIVDRKLSTVELAGCLRIAANGNALCRWGFKARQPNPCTTVKYR